MTKLFGHVKINTYLCNTKIKNMKYVVIMVMNDVPNIIAETHSEESAEWIRNEYADIQDSVCYIDSVMEEEDIQEMIKLKLNSETNG